VARYPQQKIACRILGSIYSSQTETWDIDPEWEQNLRNVGIDRQTIEILDQAKFETNRPKWIERHNPAVTPIASPKEPDPAEMSATTAAATQPDPFASQG
jgi:hypothetical protein